MAVQIIQRARWNIFVKVKNGKFDNLVYLTDSNPATIKGIFYIGPLGYVYEEDLDSNIRGKGIKSPNELDPQDIKPSKREDLINNSRELGFYLINLALYES